MKQVTKEEYYSKLMNEKEDTFLSEFNGDFKTGHEEVRKYRHKNLLFGVIKTDIRPGVYPHKETYFLN